VLTDVLEERIASIFRVEDKKKSTNEPARAGATVCVYMCVLVKDLKKLLLQESLLFSSNF
jgi:hypothetical protein